MKEMMKQQKTLLEWKRLYRVEDNEIRPNLMKSELIKAIHDLKLSKAGSVDKIPVKL